MYKERSKEEAGVVNQHGTMGAETHSKTTGESKIQKSRNLTILTAIVALVLVFGACKKDSDVLSLSGKAATNENIPYTNFDPTEGWYVNSSWVDMGTYGVRLYTEFVSGVVWNGKKVTSDAANGQDNEVQKITVRNAQGKINPELYVNEFPSFCAHVGSWAYSGGVYAPLGLDGKAYMNILSAFNWIFDTYGSIDGWFEGNHPTVKYSEGAVSTRVLAQLAVWYYIPADNDQWKIKEIRVIDNVKYGATNAAFQQLKLAVGDFADYTGNEFITGLAYLAYGLNDNMGANQPQIVPIFTPQEPGKPYGGITLTKMKRVGNEDVSAGQYEFKFELYHTDANGNLGAQITDSYYGANDDGVFPTNYMAGLVAVFNLDPGYYAFKEINQGDWKLNVGDGTHLYFTINQDGTHTWITPIQNEAVVNMPPPPPTPPVLGPAYGSVTATKAGNVPNIINSLNPKNGNPQDPGSYNAGVVYGSNHFVYAAFTMAELKAGVELDFVAGNKFGIVGHGRAIWVNGNIEVTIDNFGKGDFGVIAFTGDMVAKKCPKNGNIHSQKEADLKKELGATTGFNHDNKTVVPCPVPATANGKIYLYVHCGTIQFFQ